MIIAHPTTEEHYAKYLELCNNSRFSLSPSEFKGGIDGLREEYLKDINLNTIPLKWWDNKGLRIYLPSRGLSLSEKVSICKHYAVFNLLEAYPVFFDYSKEAPPTVRGIYRRQLTSKGVASLSVISALAYGECGEDKEKYEKWAEAMRKSFLQDGITI